MIIVNSRDLFLAHLSVLLPLNPSGVEIGVLEGDFSEKILMAINPKHFILIDPFETGGELYASGLSSAYSNETQYWSVLNRFEKEIEKGQVMVRRKYSYEMASHYPDNYIDFVYLDGSHLYPDVKKDLEDWVIKLKYNGCMCGHDYIDVDNFGVKDAVNEFCSLYNFEMIIFNSNGGDWALKRKV